MTKGCGARYRSVVRSSFLLLAIWLAAAWFGSCHAPAAGSLPRQNDAVSARTASSPVASESAPSSAAPPCSSAASLPYDLERGCAGDIDDGQPADAQLEQMGAACARGFTRLPGVALVPSGTEQQMTAKLEAYECVRFGVAGEARGAVAQARVVGPDGSELARAAGRTPLMLGRDGPVCVRAAGDYRLSVRPVGAPVGLRAALWAAPR